MKCIVAVSGGVDSVVLLDVLSRLQKYELIVAHFDHGIRPDSADDARFVAALAKKYNLPFASRREELGENASEAVARTRRYAFLRSLARDYDAVVMTAHHRDDLVETVAINIRRGTGWRGLAVLGAGDIHRPLLGMTKQHIYEYALYRRLEWVEDATNAETKYLRNQIRRVAAQLPQAVKDQLAGLRQQQLLIAGEVQDQFGMLITDPTHLSRYFFTMIGWSEATELLWQVVKAACSVSLLRTHCTYGVMAIRTGKPGTRVELGYGVILELNQNTVVLKYRDHIPKNHLK